MSRIALGIDLGGTGIKLGLVDQKGKLLRSFRFSTPSKTDPQQVVHLITEQVELLLHSLKGTCPIGIGVGCAGDVDPETGTIRVSPNLRWKNVPLKRLLMKRLRQPLVVDNDANVAAWAAYVVEAKRKIRNLVCVTLGTGVGGGLVINGKLYRGATGTAGEIGHMTVYPEGIPCNCGNQGCLERYIGVRAMASEARRAIESGETTLLSKLCGNDLTKIDPLMIQQAAKRGDHLALHLWEQAGDRLGIAMASIVNVLNPEWIVLAGGLSRARQLLLEPLHRTLLKRSFATPAKTVKLVISKLDQDLGIVGAGLVAHELLGG